MSSTDELISDIETQWEEVAEKLIAETIAAHPTEEFYTAGFWLFYVDYTVIHPPNLAINSLRYLADNPYESTRWSPSEWQIPGIQANRNHMLPIY